MSAEFFLAFLNTNMAGFVSKKFFNNTAMYQIGDIRLLPLVVPTTVQHDLVVKLAEKAIALQRRILSGANLEGQLAEVEAQINREFAHIYNVEDLGKLTDF